MKSFLVLIFLISLHTNVSAQLKILIYAPWAKNRQLNVEVGTFETTVVLSQDGTFELNAPISPDGDVKISVSMSPGKFGITQQAWSSNTVHLNGSGYVICSYSELGPLEVRGRVTVAQWPSVTWMSSKDALDIYQNGSITGSTTLKRGVEPDVPHKFTWKQNGNIICDTIITLPYNVKRTCTCDVATHKITIQ